MFVTAGCNAQLQPCVPSILQFGLTFITKATKNPRTFKETLKRQYKLHWIERLAHQEHEYTAITRSFFEITVHMKTGVAATGHTVQLTQEMVEIAIHLQKFL